MIVSALCVMLVLGFMFLLYQRSKPVRVQIDSEHGLKADTIDLAKTAFAAAESSLEIVGQTAQDVLTPLSDGVGAVLSSVADRIRSRQLEFNKLKAESISLAQEVERLRSRHINVTKIDAQAKLLLLSIQQDMYSLKRETLDCEKESLFTQESLTEYIGLRRVSCEAHVGVNINKLTFSLSNENQILIYGVREAEIFGLQNMGNELVFHEIRKTTRKGTVRSEKVEILTDDDRLAKRQEEHNQTALQEIQRNQSVEHLRAANAKFAMAFFQGCLSASGLDVEESLEPFEAPLDLGGLCLAINKRNAYQIEKKTERLLEVESDSQKVEHEILKIAQEVG